MPLIQISRLCLPSKQGVPSVTASSIFSEKWPSIGRQWSSQGFAERKKEILSQKLLQWDTELHCQGMTAAFTAPSTHFPWHLTQTAQLKAVSRAMVVLLTEWHRPNNCHLWTFRKLLEAHIVTPPHSPSLVHQQSAGWVKQVMRPPFVMEKERANL